MPAALRTSRGRPTPLGAVATADEDGVNFALLCRHGTDVTLVILPEDGSDDPLAEVALHPKKNRTGDHWHVRVHDLPKTFCYGWRVDGPRGARHRFDPTRLLIDPAAVMLSHGASWGVPAETDPKRTERRALFHNGPRYDWGDDAPPLIPLEDSVVYEVHVRGFTCHPSSLVAHPGTFKGMIEKIPYLKWLGVTTLELMPVFEWDENDCPFVDAAGEPLTNYWGYNPIAFAAPKAAFAATAGQHGQTTEFRDLVKACHAAGIEVILDVVFNHTGEGNDQGRTYNFRGLDNELYYMLDDHGRYMNFSGCGNTLNCNHPVVRDLIMACLRYWVADMHVDGFRFDLASILGRDRRGHVMVEPPVIEAIAEDGVLADTKLIAEPWDAAGLYQVGGFPFGRRWSEWNGHYRDDVRRFWKGDVGVVGRMASRVCGSSDIYQWSGRLPRHSVNFVTCHDGFTLNDMVSYNWKHNDANGEGNRDGMNENDSWNGGVEGETADPKVIEQRQRRAKSLIATMLVSQGVPMLLAGDEFLRTQKGNNNAWCQDNPISWLDWTLAEKNQGFLRFVREMIWLRRRHPVLRRRRFLLGEIRADRRGRPAAPRGDGGTWSDISPWADTGSWSGDNGAGGPFPATGPVRPSEAGLPPDLRGEGSKAGDLPNLPPSTHRPGGKPPTAPDLADIYWHGTEPFQPDFGHYSRTLAFALDGRFTGREQDPDYAPDADFYVAMNAYHEPLRFRVPPSPSRRKWRRVVDTGLASPNDFVPEGKGPIIPEGSQFIVAAYGMVVMVSDLQ